MSVELIAHRGAKREFPENTLPAFQRAYERGADAVELDVHATRDGVVVVHHDPSVHGWSGPPIAEATWAQLQSVDLGGGARIPRLADVLAMTPAARTVYVEIKGAAIEQAVADVIRARATRCAIHSFDHAAIRRLRSIAPEIPRGVLYENDSTNILIAAAAADARDVWPKHTLIDRALVDAVHEAGGRIIAWTVNDAIEAKRLADLGVDGLCGDDVRNLAT
jgi:glycerophosphoryl diester phosphodiesterase